MEVWCYPGSVMCGKCGQGLDFEPLDTTPGSKAVGACVNEACERVGVRLLLAAMKQECRVVTEKAAGATLP